MLGISGPQLPERIDVVEPGGEGSDLHAQFIGVLYGQMAEAADSQHCTLSSNPVESFQRGVDRDSSAEQWWHFSDIESLGQFDGPIVVDLHVSAKSSEKVAVEIDPLFAHLGVALLAVPAAHVRKSDRTNSHKIAHFQVGHLFADHRHLRHDLVAGAAGVGLRS